MAGSYHLIDLSSSDDVIYISDEEGNLSKYVEHDFESVDDETSIREPSTLEFENPNQTITNQNRDAKLEEDIKHAVEKSCIEVKTINMFKCKKNWIGPLVILPTTSYLLANFQG